LNQLERKRSAEATSGNSQLALFTTERQRELRSAVAFSKICLKHFEGDITKIKLHLNFKFILCFAFQLFCAIYFQQSLPSIQCFNRP
jgi:hypothetical protein